MTHQNKKEKLLVLLGIICMFVIVCFSYLLIRFLIQNLNEGLNFEPKVFNSSVFDTQGFETLDLSSEKKNIPSLLEFSTTTPSSSTEKATSTKLVPFKKI